MQGKDLSRSEAATFFGAVLDEQVTDAQIGAILAALAIKGETCDELSGFAAAMRARSQGIHSHHSTFVDTAGTGSSFAKTFNVSTAAAFVCAAAGLPVAKHGSGAATSSSGSADVLTELGVNVRVDAALSEACLNQLGICFLFAPLYHRATARVANIRRQLAVHTTFNLLGPLTNPAGAPRQIVGVWHESLLEPLAHALISLGTENAWVVHGSDGLDEITITGPTKIAAASHAGVRTFTVEPEDFGLPLRSSLELLRGGGARENALLIRGVFGNEKCAEVDLARELVVANAAAALVVGGAESNLNHAAKRADENIRSGAALRKLQAFAARTRERSQ